MTQAQHDAITAALGGKQNYGKGITPNPFAIQCVEWSRRVEYDVTRLRITEKIRSLFEPRFITPPETSECIEAIVTMTDARLILELGMCTGFTSLHILRAIVGKYGATLVSVDCDPVHDREFFTRAEISPWFEFVEGWTPDVLKQEGHYFADAFADRIFDLVFVDSDHSVEHTQMELAALWPITRKGTIFLFHDLPEWPRPDDRNPPAVREYLIGKVYDQTFKGLILPTCEQLDCVADWGPGYPPQCSPHLGVFIRQ